MDLSVVVPVYQVEQYIRTCIESIFQQGLNEECFEVIVVNDGSTDHSMERIADLIAIHKNIIVINHPQNMSMSVARNNGIAQAKGEYLLMLDSDDLLAQDSLKTLLATAQQTKADMVLADFLIKTNEEIDNMEVFQQPFYETIEKTGTETFLEDYNPRQSYVWRMLYRLQFIKDNRLSFYPNIFFEDVPFITECYLKAGKCIKTNRVLVIYRVGQNSVTRTLNAKKARDFCISLTETWKLTSLDGISEEVIDRIHDNVFLNFEFLVSWTAYSISNLQDGVQLLRFMRQRCPQIHFRHGFIQCLVSFLIHHSPTLFMAFHYYSRKVKQKFHR